MSHNISCGILILTLALAWCESAFAQASYPPEHREWEVSGFGGATIGNNFQFPTLVSVDNQESTRTVGVRYDTAYLIGVRADQNLGNLWSAGLEYSFSNQHLQFTNLSPSIQSLSLHQYLHNLSYNVALLPLPRTARFRPYGEAGIGTTLFFIPGREKRDALKLDLPLRDSWEFVFNWGGGLKYLVIDQFALTFDAKDRLSGVPSYGIPDSARVENGQYQPGIDRHGILHNWQFNFGLTFQWDE